MLKRGYPFLTVMMVLVTLLSACGGGDEGDADVSGTPATQIPNVAAAPAEGEEEAHIEAEPGGEEVQPAGGAEDVPGGQEGSPEEDPPGEGGAGQAGGGAPPAGAVTLAARDISWSTNELTLPVGGTLTLINEGASLHDFVVEGFNDDEPVEMPVGGEAVTWTVPAELAPGQYIYYCSVPGHRALMEGTLTIQ